MTSLCFQSALNIAARIRQREIGGFRPPPRYN